MSWDAWQRDVLEALGHQVYVVATPELPRLPDDPLLHALLKAAGVQADPAASHALAATLPSLSELRGDATALRVLWPRLRTLRRAPAGDVGHAAR